MVSVPVWRPVQAVPLYALAGQKDENVCPPDPVEEIYASKNVPGA
jgi:hypothetical protein